MIPTSSHQHGTDGVTTGKRKATDTGNKNDKLIHQAEEALELLKDWREELVRPGSDEDRKTFRDLQIALKWVIGEKIVEETCTFLELRFPVPDGDRHLRAQFSSFNTSIAELEKMCKDRLEYATQYATAIPPPSEYARDSVWAKWQQEDTAILCSRPHDRRGLPLCVLHNAFREFQTQAKIPLPSADDAVRATIAASKLCCKMPNCFATESDRGDVFTACLDPLFPRSSWRKESHISGKTERCHGKMGWTYEPEGVICILREDKVEIGTGDDAYMQVSRGYQLFVEQMRELNEGHIERGVPVFLLCVLGPMLLICGGFHDGKSTIIEPLVQPCMMLDDQLQTNQKILAQYLFGLHRAVHILRSRSDGDTGHQPDVPRVYTTYKTEDGIERRLTFLRPLTNELPQPLLFIATSDDPRNPSSGVLVKLAVKEYGVRVHQLLAERRLAPKLYGQRSLEGAPTAYIMEFLPSPTPTSSGWITLFKFLRGASARQHSKAIRSALDSIVKGMEEAGMVHGDLRPNNILLEVDSSETPVHSDEGVNLRIVDFDWAGQSGEVFYPSLRNEEITWPGAPGGPILVGHDGDLVEMWWSAHFP